MACKSCGIVAKRRVVGVGDNTTELGTGNFLYAVNSNHVAICSGLAAIFSGKFQSMAT